MGQAFSLKEAARGDRCGLIPHDTQVTHHVCRFVPSQSRSLFQGPLPKAGHSRASGAQGHLPHDWGAMSQHLPCPAHYTTVVVARAPSRDSWQDLGLRGPQQTASLVLATTHFHAGYCMNMAWPPSH